MAVTARKVSVSGPTVPAPSSAAGRPPPTTRTPLYAAAGLLLTMTVITATMIGNRRVEAVLRAAAPVSGPDRPEPAEPARQSAPDVL